jgi:hypothetical protein
VELRGFGPLTPIDAKEDRAASAMPFRGMRAGKRPTLTEEYPGSARHCADLRSHSALKIGQPSRPEN